MLGLIDGQKQVVVAVSDFPNQTLPHFNRSFETFQRWLPEGAQGNQRLPYRVMAIVSVPQCCMQGTATNQDSQNSARPMPCWAKRDKLLEKARLARVDAHPPMGDL